MRLLAALLLAALTVTAQTTQITNTYAVQTPATRQILLFSATGTGRSLSPASIRGMGVVSHTVQWVVTGGPAACTLDIESSTDASSWSTVSSQTCTSGGSYSFADAGYIFLGVNLSAFSGGTSPTITVTYQGTGATGQIPLPTTLGGTGVIGPFTDGSIVFAGSTGIYSQNNAQFHWDRTNARLGLGTAAPAQLFDVGGNFTVTAAGLLTGKSSIFTATNASTVGQIINAAASQTSPIQNLRNSSGNVLASFDATANPQLASGKILAWSSSATDATTTKDTGLARNAAGVIEVINGTANTYRDLKLRTLFTTGTLLGGHGANTSSNTTTTLPAGNLFHITGTNAITTLNTCDASNDGRVVTLIFDDVLTFTDGNNLKLAGNFVTTADDTITLVCDGAGTNWYETARSVN